MKFFRWLLSSNGKHKREEDGQERAQPTVVVETPLVIPEVVPEESEVLPLPEVKKEQVKEDSVQDLEDSLPGDSFTLNYYELASNSFDDEKTFKTLELLHTRYRLKESLVEFSKKISILTQDAAEKEWRFEELKTDKMIQDLNSLPTIDEEVVHDGLNSVENVGESREALFRVLSLLSRLELSRSKVINELIETLQELRDMIPEKPDSEVSEHIEPIDDELTELESVENYATSDGEWIAPDNRTVSDDENDEVKDVVQDPNDSVFHLE